MIDIGKIKLFLETDFSMIDDTDILTLDLLAFLAHYPTTKVAKLFKTGDKGPIKFTCELICFECGNKFKVQYTKTKIIDLLRKIKNEKYNTIVCDDCKEKSKERAKIEHARFLQEMEQRREDKTDEYIKDYINPNVSWVTNTSNHRKMSKLRADVDFNKVAKVIKGMPYHDFLQTPYWKAIAEKVRIKAGYRCQLCNQKGILSVHHRTYDIHGYELQNMGELVCLCSECHNKYHFE